MEGIELIAMIEPVVRGAGMVVIAVVVGVPIVAMAFVALCAVAKAIAGTVDGRWY